MKLVRNAKAIAARSHSMWAFYASLICLVLPELIYGTLQIDTNPRVWWLAGIALLIYGVWGRLSDQGIDTAHDVDHTKAQSLWAVGIIAVTLAVAVMFSPDFTRPFTADTALPPVASTVDLASDTNAPRDPMADYDTRFLASAVPFIGRWEGLRLDAYLDIVGVPTVCYGETKGVKLGDSYTKAECDEMLAREIIDYRDRLRPAFTADTLERRMPLGRDVAFTSLAYNVGVHGTAKSTAVRRLNDLHIAGACQALGWFNKAGGRVIRGLVNRRSEETELCLAGLT
ncbi:lysozyme [uncultured Tateyamaria sp.]|uniref:lysozyme n=1 Tax=uncultured Tateyamaria sp. TaxID=455651 RepID=UPI0026125AB2|nr:lysozyme [uncultured Tateyamaria sp.]